MPFIGKQPEVGAYSKLDAITTSATATYNLTLDSGAYYPTSANHLLVSLNGVMQAPQDSFTVSGSTIVFASTLASTDSIDFIMALGDVLDIGTPSDGTVTTAKIVDNSITSSKLAGALTTPSNLTVGGVLDATTATFDRASTDGVIVNLQKNNVSVGSIDVDNGDNLTVQGKSDHSGLQFGTNAIFPHKNSANIDATIDLGEGSLRWKDIYLSGGLNFSANANNAGMSSETLDDYEEGTFTPFMRINNGVEGITYNGRVGSYTKIGNLVTCMIYMNLSSKGTNVGGVSIDGLPFTAGNNLGVVTSFNGNCLPAYFSSMATNISTLHGWVDDGTTEMYLRHTDGGGNSSTQNTNNGNINNNTDFRFFITYMV
jgi:hypothetical protein